MTETDAVDRFLADESFEGYQSVPLPGGRAVPGVDRSRVADIVFRDGVVGKTVLDIGTYYGFLPLEALRRGASSAVGLEPDAERFRIAHRIAQLNGGYEVVNSSLEELETTQQFDLVCFLNVLHHVVDPVFALRAAAALCSGTLMVEFCLADDPDYIQFVNGDARVTPLTRARARARSAILRAAGLGLPLMAVGNREYHRVFYFSREAFANLMTVHLGLASEIEFRSSGYRKRRLIAACKMTNTT